MEIDLRLRARKLMHAGALPTAIPHRTWGGNGSGEPCSLCGNYIRPSDVEYELEVSDNAHQTAYRFYRFHLMCHAAWQFESSRQMHLNDSLATETPAKPA
jgi:hypothetical protein